MCLSTVKMDSATTTGNRGCRFLYFSCKKTQEMMNLALSALLQHGHLANTKLLIETLNPPTRLSLCNLPGIAEEPAMLFGQIQLLIASVQFHHPHHFH